MSEAAVTELMGEGVDVYPPSFCSWRQLLAVAVITEVSVVLVGLGHGGQPGWQWFGMATVYAQWMALFCASGLCVTSGWTGRMSSSGAWIGSWLIVVLLAAVFSAAAWLAAGFALPGGAGEPAGLFVVRSAFAVGLVTVVFFRYLVIRARWRAELIAQAEARVQALQARIRPHFLFNSLNTIASLIHDQRPVPKPRRWIWPISSAAACAGPISSFRWRTNCSWPASTWTWRSAGSANACRSTGGSRNCRRVRRCCR